MKKSMVIFILLAILTAVSFPLAVFRINSQKEAVVLTEDIWVGDQETARGLSFQINTQLENRLLWETKVKFREKTETDTEFTFLKEPLRYEENPVDTIDIYSITGFGMGSNADVLAGDAGTDLYYQKIFEDLAGQMEGGETLTKIVNPADYYKYFQISANLYNIQYLDGYSYISDAEISRKLTETFAVEIPKDMQVEVSLTKNLAGEVCEVGMNPYAHNVSFHGTGCFLPDACYFSVYAENDDTGSVWEMTGIKTGIYKLPIREMVSEVNPKRSFRGLDWDLLEPLYLTDGNIVAMETDEAGENIGILLEKEDGWYVQVVNIEKAESVSMLRLETEGDAKRVSIFQMEKDGILIVLEEEKEHIYYLENKENRLEKRIDVDIAGCSLHSSKTIELWEPEYDYDNGRLAMIWQVGYYRNVGVYVMVMDQDGIGYLAKFENSQDIGNDHTIRFHESCPFQISWQ